MAIFSSKPSFSKVCQRVAVTAIAPAMLLSLSHPAQAGASTTLPIEWLSGVVTLGQVSGGLNNTASSCKSGALK
jgi:hypothetical protein